MRVCWNRQTGTFEGRVSLTYGFKSRHSHHFEAPVTRTILRQFLTASFVLPFFLKMPENGLNTGLLRTHIVELRKVEIG